MIIFKFLIIISQCFSQNFSHLPTKIESTYFQEGKKISDGLIAEKVNLKDSQFFFKLIEKIGPVLIPESSFRHIKKADNQLIYDAKYDLGPFGNRERPIVNTKAVKHLIIAGESNTFGDGNNLEQTFVYLLAKDFVKFQVYNFGHRGGGPNNTLALFQNFNLKDYISESKGIFIFNLFEDVIMERVIGSKNHACWDNGNSPYYKIENNELKHLGNFKDRFFIHPFYRLICNNKKLNELIKNLPRITEDHYQLLAMILKEIEKTYLKHWPQGKFYVVVNHAFENSYLPMNKKIIPWLIKHNISYRELPSISYVINRTFPYDQHLNKNGQKEEYLLFKNFISKLETN